MEGREEGWCSFTGKRAETKVWGFFCQEKPNAVRNDFLSITWSSIILHIWDLRAALLKCCLELLEHCHTEFVCQRQWESWVIGRGMLGVSQDCLLPFHSPSAAFSSKKHQCTSLTRWMWCHHWGETCFCKAHIKYVVTLPKRKINWIYGVSSCPFTISKCLLKAENDYVILTSLCRALFHRGAELP